MARFKEDENFYFFDQYNKIHLLLEVQLKQRNPSRFESLSFPRKRKLMYVFLRELYLRKTSKMLLF